MSHWELVRQQYPTKLELTEPETHHLPYTTKESFAANIQGERILFVKFGREAIYSRGVGHTWKYEDGRETIEESHFKASFVDYGLVDNLNYHTGTAEFQGKEVKYDRKNHRWTYLNNRPVNFHTPSERNTPVEEEEDTVQVKELLEMTERTIVAATQKLSLGQLSHPPTPQTGLVFRQTRPVSALPGSFPVTTGKGKQRQPSTGLIAGPSFSAANLSTPPTQISSMPPSLAPVQVPTQQAPLPPPRGNPPPAQNLPTAVQVPAPIHQAPPPPPGGNPPPAPNPPAANMAAAPPQAIRTTPDAFDRNPAKAKSFWNTLENYYTLNDAVYTNEGQKVVAALTHFKMGTSAGDWASDHLATALGATPITYSTWADFKTKFREQFIHPQTQVESIQKIHDLPMGNREFNEWYQDWSMHARRANVNEQTRIYAFRKNLNQSLHQKIVQMSPQPDTMTALVKATRDLDKNWRMFAGPPRSGPRCPGIRALDDKPNTEINAFQGKPKK
jgi:hypothetical protein